MAFNCKKLISSATLVTCVLLMSACSEAFWDSMADDDTGSYQQRSFYGQIKRISTVYYAGGERKAGGSAGNGALLGAIVGGLAGAGLSNGSGVGTIVGAGAGAAIGGAAAQNSSLRDSDFSENNRGKRATRLVILKDDGDRVVIIQRFTRAFMPGDRVKVSVFRDGSTRVKRVMDQRSDRPYYKKRMRHEDYEVPDDRYYNSR
ncbi:hypothetical protein [Candidatus Ichthyocystis hellenicum]|uniref:hypothetical protein n=1 Tax=Candidatus Ichthyocystis hellenicum TaxID=1561003 RepID=UPI000B8908EB|nr:hypothetical protein [Candidatus Ichthyocystis hellenicum]